MARRVLPLLEPYLPLFVEEPVVPEHGDHLAAAGRDSTPSRSRRASGCTHAGTSRRRSQAGIAVAQPDVSHAGGISETRRIAALAEAHDVALAPHCPLGPIALAACLQVDFASPTP